MQFLTFNGLLLALIMPFFVQAEINGDNDLHVEQLAKGLSIPWGIAVLPDNSLLITQRNNTLSHLNPDSGKTTNIMGLPEDVLVSGQGGLFDVQLSPDYVNNGWLYFSYSKEIDGQGTTTLSRAKLQDKQLVHWQDLIVTQSRTDNKVHFGGRISFDNNGHVFLSIGDRGERDNAQNRSNHAGSILRLNLDGTVPSDNPFIDQANVLPEIWSYGHRNPQGLFFNQQTDQLWAIEHGPRGGDEINLVKAGKNYGWPEISYGKEYWAPLAVGKEHQEGMEQPIKMYDPSIAPSGLVQYQTDLFKDWKGKLLTGAMKLQHLNIITLNDNDEAVDEKRLLKTLNSRIRNVIEAPDGALLIATDSGDIYRVTPTDSQ
ncbi:PQQ-dependent sugar dehydrogenase [Methylophaga thiooxydans]|uniref:PQQ-dependent sugar dehydrogenase n=1 Tax=Methylophaga thiooxydans TaxID=392484 RepID=UPI002353B5C6|nr:PQQ-dependent sugar dehydrogenase [Methylophaga thiooxydans]